LCPEIFAHFSPTCSLLSGRVEVVFVWVLGVAVRASGKENARSAGGWSYAPTVSSRCPGRGVAIWSRRCRPFVCLSVARSLSNRGRQSRRRHTRQRRGHGRRGWRDASRRRRGRRHVLRGRRGHGWRGRYSGDTCFNFQLLRPPRVSACVPASRVGPPRMDWAEGRVSFPPRKPNFAL
jgi:hypothetical protein